MVRSWWGLRPIRAYEPREVTMSESARPWTAEILIDGQILYAWMARDPKYGTFAIANRDHARRFRTKEDVEGWIQRLKVPNATAINLDDSAGAPGGKRPAKAGAGAGAGK